MEVHSHAHSPRKKWTHYFWEFIMLFLAVFCGFMAENFREHQVEHKRTIRYAKQFINEIELDTARINDGILFVRRKELAVDSLIHALNKKDWQEIYYWGLHIDDYYIAKFHSASFEQIKYSGYLRNFKNDKLVTAILDYINFRDNVEIVQTDLVSFYNRELTPFINRNFDKQYLAELGENNKVTFENLWNNNPMQFHTTNLVEFRNMLITIRKSYSLGGFYKMLVGRSTELILLLKEEFHIK